MMNTVIHEVIRVATTRDAEGIARLSGQLGYQSAPDQAAHRLLALKEHPDHETLVAEDGGALIGWVHVHLRHSLLTDGEAEIAALVVDENQRGRGIGRVLLEAAERWAKDHGCRSVRLRSNVTRIRAHSFYERLGYEVTKSSKLFRKELA